MASSGSVKLFRRSITLKPQIKVIEGAGWEGISGKNYIGPGNISEIRSVVEGSVSEPEPVISRGRAASMVFRSAGLRNPVRLQGSHEFYSGIDDSNHGFPIC